MTQAFTVVLAVPPAGLEQYVAEGYSGSDCPDYYTAIVTAKDLPSAVLSARKEHAKAMKSDGVVVGPEAIPVVIVLDGHPEIKTFSFQNHLYERRKYGGSYSRRPLHL